MSLYSKDQFNVWFPALFCGLVIGLLAAAGWDILRRRFWCCVSRFWPGVLGEVGLDNLSRVEVEERNRLVSDMLSAVHTAVTTPRVTPSLSMANAIDPNAAESSNSSNSSMSSSNDFDLEGQEPVIHPFPASTGRPITFTATAYFADGTPTFVILPVKRFLKRHGNGTVKRWKSSIVLQASLPIEACVVAEFEELARISILEENQCTFQLGNWAILYYKAGKVCLHELKEGDVPVNVEARWQDETTGIEMRGLYLNGAQVKVATEHTSTILRSVGPATKGQGDFDELNFNIEDLDVPREYAIIVAAKLIDGDGISLIVRSEATFIRPERAKSTVTEASWSWLQWIFQSAKMMTKSLFKTEDRQLEIALTLPDFFLDQEQCELIIEHWKGVLEIEILEKRKEVLHYLQELRESGESYARFSDLYFIRDRHSEGYWQRVLQELNEVILQHEGYCSQSGTHIRLRGGIRFLLGNYEDALHDFDRAHLVMQDDHWTTLYERALVKCMLARYSEALEDVCSVISINPNFSDIQELKTCIQHILDQRTPFRLVQDGVLSLQSQPLHVAEIPDLLTGDERHSSGADCSRIVPNWWSSEDSTDLAQPKDVVVAVGADPWPLNPSEPDGDLPQDYGHQCEDPFLLALAAGSGRTESLSYCASSRDEAQLWQEVVNDVGRQTTSSDHIELTDGRTPKFIIGNRSFKSYAGFMQGILQSEIQENLDQGSQAPTSNSAALDLMAQLTISMPWLRNQQIAHRDLKARNVLISLHDSPYRPDYLPLNLADFGLSRAGPTIRNIGASGSLEPALETKMYRAPEVFSQDARVSEKRYPRECDVWSYGLLFSDILHGKVPFQAIPPTRLNEAILSHARAHLPPSCPEELASIIRDCWVKDHRKRPLFVDICSRLRSGVRFGIDLGSPSARGVRVAPAEEVVQYQGDARESEQQAAEWTRTHEKIRLLSWDSMSPVSDIKLIRTDSTLAKEVESGIAPELDPPVSTYAHGECSESAGSESAGSESADSLFVQAVSRSHVRNDSEQAAEVDDSKLITDLSSRNTEVPRDAAHQIRWLTKMNTENRLTIAEQGGTPFLNNPPWSLDDEITGSESAYSESADSPFVSESHGSNDSEQAAEVDVSKLITDLSSRRTEVHRDAAHQIRWLTKMNSVNRLTIAEQGGIPFISNLLRSPDKMTQEHAVTALLNVSLLESNRALIMRAGAIDGIVHVVKWGQSMEARENAAATIQCLSYGNENKISIGNTGAIPALVELLQNGTLQGKKDAASALCNLTSYLGGNKKRAIRTGIITVLMDILHDHSTHDLDDMSLAILANLSVLADGLVEIGNTEPAIMLIYFITYGSSKGQELATALLCRLCSDDPCFIEAAYQCGATDPLEAVLRSETTTLRCKRKAQRLLDRLSDGAQLRQEVVNDRRGVLEFVNDRRDVLNPRSQIRTSKTKMGLVGSPRASGSNSTLQLSTIACQEPQAQPRFDRQLDD